MVFFEAVAVSIILNEGTTSRITKRIQKKPDENGTRMSRALLNQSWKQQQRNLSCMVTYLPSLKPSKINQPHRTLLEKSVWTHKWHSSIHPYTRTSQYWPTRRTYSHQLCTDTEENDVSLGQTEREREREKREREPVKYGLSAQFHLLMKIDILLNI